MIEGEEYKLIRPAFVHCRLQPAEYWQAVPVQCAKLAVEVGRLYFQRAQGFDGALISMRSIQTGSGEQLDLVAIDPRVHAVAVVFDLMQPLFALGRFLGEAREPRLDPFRRLGTWGHESNGSRFPWPREVAFQIRGGAGWPAWNVQAR